MELIDYSINHPPADTIAPYVGAMRYGSENRNDLRILTLLERDSLFANGIGIGMIWEKGTRMCMGGGRGGQIEGFLAKNFWDSMGAPQDKPIAYAIDFQPAPWEMPTIEAFLRSCANYGRPIGIYGDYESIEYFGSRGIGSFYWQCVAWSYGRVSNYAHLFQNFGLVLNNTSDRDTVLKPATVNEWLWTPQPIPVPIPGGKMIASAVNADGRAEVFLSDGTDVYHAWQENPGSGPWSPRVRLAGADSVTDLSAILNPGTGALELFVECGPNSIWHTYQDPASPGGWVSLTILA